MHREASVFLCNVVLGVAFVKPSKFMRHLETKPSKTYQEFMLVLNHLLSEIAYQQFIVVYLQSTFRKNLLQW